MNYTVQEIFDDVSGGVAFSDDDELRLKLEDYMYQTYPLIHVDFICDCYINVWKVYEGPVSVGSDYELKTTQEIEDEFRRLYPEECI